MRDIDFKIFERCLSLKMTKTVTEPASLPEPGMLISDFWKSISTELKKFRELKISLKYPFFNSSDNSTNNKIHSSSYYPSAPGSL